MNYRRKIFMGIIIISLGVVLQNQIGSIGTVMIAIGGLFFIAGMAAKRKEEESKSD